MSGADVLTELRAWRDEFARSHGYDLAAMAAALRELDRTAGARVVQDEPRRPATMLPEGAATPPHELSSGSWEGGGPRSVRGG